MSLPPNVIRVKRKRVEESPVTFLPAASEPRRFRVSKAMLAAAAAAGSGGAAGAVSKRDRYGTPTLFVERSRRKKLAPKPRRSMVSLQSPDGDAAAAKDVEVKALKRPGVARRAREAAKTKAASTDDDGGDTAAKPTTSSATTATANPLPPSLTNRAAEDMRRITADMNEWVMREMGANLQSMEEERKRVAAAAPLASPSRLRPKAPAQRYHERHPEVPAPGSPAATATDVEGDTNMTDASEEEDGDDDDWVIEEYVRIPANSVALDVAPSDVGFLVLDGEEESLLFFGSQNDEDEDWDEDEEDENAENHYTADYPEDEVDSEDEFNRNAYYFRNMNASDDEEYDQDDFDEDGDARSADGGGEDDDARMTRILEQMKRLKALQR
ncbi:hypothetical protein CRV24_008317 [Beauveria bassiana]|nr:hypothetical protein CRV24_008317 [Beauveria bassiana]